jgi:hypothetical protein
MKRAKEKKIVRLEAKLTDLTSRSGTSVDIDVLVYKATENLKKLDLLYLNADTEGQRFIIGSIFREKWTYLETGHRTTNINEAASLIHQIDSTLAHKKSRIRTSLRTESGIVLRTIQISKHFIEDLEVLSRLIA